MSNCNHSLLAISMFVLTGPASLAQEIKGEAATWPMHGGSPSRNMVNLKARNLPVTWNQEEGKNILWTAKLGSRSTSLIAADGRFFAGTNNDRPRDKKNFDDRGKPIVASVLMAFDQASGKFLWQSAFPRKCLPVNDWPRHGLQAAPTIDAGRMYYLSNCREVICSSLDGKTIWTVDLMEKLKVFPHGMFYGAAASSILVVGDDLYLITGNGVDESHCNIPSPEAPSFVKMRKQDGKILWQDNSPTINFAPFKGQLDTTKAFTELAKRGKIINHGQWSSPAYAMVAGQPQIIFPGGDGWIYAFAPEGNLLWKFDGNPKGAVGGIGKIQRSDYAAMPVIYKDHVYIGMGGDPEHQIGEGRFWCISMDKRGDVSPEIVVNGNVWPPVTKPNPNSAAAWRYGGPVALKDQAKVKRTTYFDRTMSTCAIHEDLLYAADLDGIIYCFDAISGKLHWEHNSHSSIYSSPVWADRKIYVGNDDGRVLVFAHGKEKKLLAENEMEAAVRKPVIAGNGVIYLIVGNGTLVAVGKK